MRNRMTAILYLATVHPRYIVDSNVEMSNGMRRNASSLFLNSIWVHSEVLHTLSRLHQISSRSLAILS